MEPSRLSFPAGQTDLIGTGQCFWYNTAAAGVVAAAVGTSSAPFIWNPSDSGVRLRILRVRLGIVSGTVIAAHHAYGIMTGAGAQLGTAQPVVSFTAGVPINAYYGKGLPSQMRFCPLTCSLTGGPSYLMPSRISSEGALAAGPLVVLEDRLDGDLIISPGQIFFPYISNAAMALTAAVSVLAWEEIIPAGSGR